MAEETFTDFKRKFYSKISDGSEFDCENFNLLKVTLDGLRQKYSFNSYFGKPILLLKWNLIFKRIFRKKKKNSFLQNISQFENIKIFIHGPGRMIKDNAGKNVSFYFENLIQHIGRQNLILSLTSNLSEETNADINMLFFCQNDYLIEISKEDAELYSSLVFFYTKLKAKNIFNAKEIVNIKCALDLFWRNFRIWNFLLRKLNVKICFLIPHYQREGEILALKRNKIHVVELQHGLIAEEDIFYIFPEKVKSILPQALFADEIWTFGKFWSNALLKGHEYSQEKIKIVGDYIYRNKSNQSRSFVEIKSWSNKFQNVILIAAQTYMEQYYKKYISWLANDLNEKKISACIIVKPHPSQTENIYIELEKNKNVKVSSEHLDSLFEISNYHLSVYSTTLYEAVNYNVKNFTLYIPEFADYVEGIINNKIATKIEMEQNPISSEYNILEKNLFMYEKFNLSLLDFTIKSLT